MAELTEKIIARTGKSSYDILIGSSILPSVLEDESFSSYNSIVIIVSSRVNELHGEYLTESTQRLDHCEILLMDDGEENKNYKHAEGYLNKFIKNGMNRRSAVIGIGGGVVGDFAGFLSAIYMRGISIIHVPTTLLAMVDSSIGGKVAVNLAVGKNIAGVFHQPGRVISDVKFLKTLPDQELKNGLTESMKHGLIGDTASLELLEENDLESIKHEDVISKLISLSASFKSKIVEKDEKEGGLRAILNYGHTVGHAIESLTEYKGVSHGDAVAAGIKVKVEISRRLGFLSDAEAKRVLAVMDRYGLVRDNISLDIDKVMSHMNYDKKNFDNKVNFVLLKGIGNPSINQQIDEDILRDVLGEYLS